jgi:hypothetical protein
MTGPFWQRVKVYTELAKCWESRALEIKESGQALYVIYIYIYIYIYKYTDMFMRPG